MYRLYVTAPAGTADLAAEELTAVGVADIKVERGGVACRGTLEQAYRACLWSRVANRVLLPIAEFPAATPDELYAGARSVEWHEHLGQETTFAVDCTVSRSAIGHSQFAALRVKDAVADQFRERTGARPSVDTEAPDVQLNVHIDRDVATLAIDLSGDSLHRRGYRGAQGAAPLKENLAAAVLLRAGWPKLLAEGAAAVGFVDPMCGSGSLAIEAALIAAHVAPGLLRERFGLVGWRGHDAALWSRLRAEAAERRAAASGVEITIHAYDRDARAVRATLENAARAGFERRLHAERRELADLPSAPVARGLVAVNPPYGERLGDVESLVGVYGALGERLRAGFVGWQAAVLTGNPPLGRELKLKARRTHRMFNGPIECRLLRFDIEPKYFETKRTPGALPAVDEEARARPGAAMFGNRLRKNAATLGTWARAEGIACYRVYDADMPEYAFSIDLYASGTDPEAERWVYVQEYAPPPTVDAAKARARRAEAFAVIPDVLGVARERVHLRTRRRQKGGAQYAKLAERGEFCAVAEGGLSFEVNFTDYLDTGLFLDHRPTRARLRELAAGKRFLNLFAYTGAATVYAAAGGARSTTSVDLSRTYLDWTRRNLERNGFADARKHELVQADVLAWLEQPPAARYDLVFLDPPTASRSKRMAHQFDLQRDHVALIRSALLKLAPGGVMIFSNNFRKFRLDAAGLADLDVRNVTAESIPRDFARDARIHHCFEIRVPLGRERTHKPLLSLGKKTPAEEQSALE
jgi:23S rRNA (guanine2069-N7)-methyltransferase / 23S rRNA (guanine2445-N2)-methyltransferase